MLVFLYGKDNFRSSAKLREIVQKYKEKFPGSLSYKKIEGKKLDLEEFKSLAQGAALFQEKKLIIVRNIFEIWMPLAYSEDIKNEFEFKNLSFGEQIRFTLKLELLDPFEQLRNLKP